MLNYYILIDSSYKIIEKIKTSGVYDEESGYIHCLPVNDEAFIQATHFIDGELIKNNSLIEVITSALATLAAYRYSKEVGGITVAGTSILTDRESQATLTGAYVAVQLNPTRLIDWKTSDGTWTQIDKATVEFLASAVADHVQACFSNEKVHSTAINLLTTIEEVEAYDITVGWPA